MRIPNDIVRKLLEARDMCLAKERGSDGEFEALLKAIEAIADLSAAVFRLAASLDPDEPQDGQP